MNNVRLVSEFEANCTTYMKDRVVRLSLLQLQMTYGSIQARTAGEFKDYAMWLDGEYDWHIGKDNEGKLILFATYKP